MTVRTIPSQNVCGQIVVTETTTTTSPTPMGGVILRETFSGGAPVVNILKKIAMLLGVG